MDGKYQCVARAGSGVVWESDLDQNLLVTLQERVVAAMLAAKDSWSSSVTPGSLQSEPGTPQSSRW